MTNLIYEEISSIIIEDGSLDNYDLLTITSLIKTAVNGD